MIGAEQDQNGTSSGLIRDVYLIETVAGYNSSDIEIPKSLSATVLTNKELILRITANYVTTTEKLAYNAIITDIHKLTVGKSILIRTEQAGGLGNSKLALYGSSGLLNSYVLAPFGLYLLSKVDNSNAYVFQSLDQGEFTTISIAALVSRKIGFGVYATYGMGGVFPASQLLIPDASTGGNVKNGKIVVLNYNTATICISSISNEPLRALGGTNVYYYCPQGVTEIYYADGQIFVK